MRPLLSVVLLQCIFFTVTNAQIYVNGRVLQTSQQAISYVNIGIKGKNKGTVANEKGEFSLSLTAELINDTLTFSCIGFEELNLPVQQIIKEKTSVFYLKEKMLGLKEIIISTRKPEIKKIGTKSTNPLLWGDATSKDGKDIVEMGRFIEIKKASEIQKLNIYLKGISNNSATFRINFYAVKDEMPGERIIEKNILCKKDLSKGWLEIDLTEYNLFFEQDFVVAIEFLPEKDSKGYSFSYGGQMGGSTFTRTSSLGTWKKLKGASLSMYLTVKQ
ncbi:MAG TPA: carboxypeptidase-like regulatory domain-containing protein [Lacibacter sp.]|nr:carboxypeptidase-like regulatory domain-containing protein [Lacibacter sp.]